MGVSILYAYADLGMYYWWREEIRANHCTCPPNVTWMSLPSPHINRLHQIRRISLLLSSLASHRPLAMTGST